MLTIHTAFQVRRYYAFTRWMSDIIAGARDGMAIWNRYEALSRHTEQDLDRRGLTRDDFPRLAVNGGCRAIATGQPPSDKDSGGKRAPVFGHLATLFANIHNIRGRTEACIVRNYKGRGWDDATERELNNELVNCRCHGF